MKKTLYLSLICIVSALSAYGQPATWLLEMEPAVDSTGLQVNLFIKKLSGADISLGPANFVFELNQQAIDLNGKVFNYQGAFDDNLSPNSYENMLLQGSQFVNITTRRSFGTTGTGVPVTAQRQQIAGVRIPITDACQFANLSWLSQRGAITDYQKNNLKPFITFSNPPNIPLCLSPVPPVLSVLGPINLCPGDSIQLSATGTNISWIDAADSLVLGSGTSFWVSQAGSYAALASNCICKSAPALVQVQEAIVPSAPLVSQSSNMLTASNVQGHPLQWFLNGQILAGDTSAMLTMNQAGVYKAGLQGPCGWVYSNEIAFNVAQLDDELLVDDLKVYPNPFRDQTNAFLTLSSGTKLNLDIIDAQGKVIKTIEQQTWKDKGVYTIPIKIKEMEDAAGTYFLRASFRNQNKIIKLIAK
jgi:hypothetical protein